MAIASVLVRQIWEVIGKQFLICSTLWELGLCRSVLTQSAESAALGYR